MQKIKDFLKILAINLFVLLGVLMIVWILGEGYLRFNKFYRLDSISAVGIPIFEPDDLNTYKHKNFSKAENGYGSPTPKIEINNIGLRDKIFLPREHRRNILMLGDSFTFGTGVDQGETYTERLEKKINIAMPHSEWNIWNGGHVGYSIGNYYVLLKKLAPVLKPDLVVVNIFVGNDITELRRKNWIYGPRENLIKVVDQKVFANAENQLESRTEKKPLSYFLHFVLEKIEILKYKYGKNKASEKQKPTLTWPVFLDKNQEGADPEIEIYWNEFFKGFSQIQYWGLQNDVPIVFVIMPMDVQVSSSYRKKYSRIYFNNEAFEAKRPQKRIMTACRKTNADCLDLLPSFQENRKKEDIYFNHNADPHLSILGHNVVAHLLFQKIKNLLD